MSNFIKRLICVAGLMLTLSGCETLSSDNYCDAMIDYPLDPVLDKSHNAKVHMLTVDEGC